jgi:putative transposase
MPRKLRQEVAGGVFHVYARGNNKADIYVDDEDRWLYLALLGRVVARQRWSCLAYCLMPNHVHLLLETADPNLAEGMQFLHGRFAQGFNMRHGRVGHLFQGRYGAVPVTDDAQLWTTVGYVATNPVTAGLVEVPEAWMWSSHRATVGQERPAWLATGRLLQLLSGHGGDPLERYREVVADRLARGVTVSTSLVSVGAAPVPAAAGRTSAVR